MFLELQMFRSVLLPTAVVSSTSAPHTTAHEAPGVPLQPPRIKTSSGDPRRTLGTRLPPEADESGAADALRRSHGVKLNPAATNTDRFQNRSGIGNAIAETSDVGRPPGSDRPASGTALRVSLDSSVPKGAEEAPRRPLSVSQVLVRLRPRTRRRRVPAGRASPGFNASTAGRRTSATSAAAARPVSTATGASA